ncbi:MAG: exopolyphosphatase [Bacteroidota bacterium]
MKKRIAALDLGTNLFHLLIAEINSSGKVSFLLKEDFMVTIGEGGMAQKEIIPVAYKRGLDTMTHIQKLVSEYEVEEVVGCATSAIRDAGNGQQFVDEVGAQTGIHIDIIHGHREAELIHKGVLWGADMDKDQPALLIDIGGGSVELILSKGGEIIWLDSLQLGAARLAEKFPVLDPIPSTYFSPLKAHIRSVLQSLPQIVFEHLPTNWIGVNGAFDTLSHMLMEDQHKDDDFPHRFEFRMKEYEKVASQLYQSTIKERTHFAGMIPVRIDNIVLACAVIEVLAEILPPETIQVSQYALLEGLIFERLID